MTVDTDGEQAGGAFRGPEDPYRAVFDATIDGLIINDFEGRTVDVNPAFCEMHGYSREELLQRPHTAWVPPQHEHAFQLYLDTVKTSGLFHRQGHHVRKDGSIFPVEVHGTVFTYQSQPHILGIVRDITQRAEAYLLLEQLVAERTHELSTLLDISRNVASMRELDPLLGLILDQLKLVADYNRAAIFLIEADTITLLKSRSVSVEADGDDFEGVPYSAAQLASLRRILHETERTIIADLETDGPLEQPWRGALEVLYPTDLHQFRSWLAVPLILKDRVIGLLTLASTQSHLYTPSHAQLALAVANQAALAIENARLFAEVQGKAALEERQRLARELHDSVSQALYGIVLGTETARAYLHTDPARLDRPLEYIRSLADAGLAEMKALIFELRPESLATEGLVGALTKQAAAIQARYEIQVETDLGDEPSIPLDMKEALYRIAQEAMHNVVKHTQATCIEVQLSCPVGYATVEVRDNGMGFETGGDFPGHLGLKSMRERAARLGGTLEVKSAPGQGTIIRASVPRQGITSVEHSQA